ncbi:MAG: ABC transporter permease [Candidatus Bathyarchaeota archaeon]|nr:ABC transporter permease [Candidatus Bathyarchaeota archaeon]
MSAPRWLVVARNEYRIRTSRIRRIRPYFLWLVVGFLVIYVALIAPRLVSLFFDELQLFILSQTAEAMVPILLFIIFVYFMMIPVTETLRQEQTGQLEIFLAAPIKPSDVLLGEFLGEMPFYAIFITVITGFFAAFLLPLGLDLAQIAVTIIIFIITFLSAFWIGTVIAAILRTKLGETTRGRDIGRALAMIIALPLVALIYGIMYGGVFQALANSETSGLVRTILSMLPSSWGAEVIVSFASNRGNIGAFGLETAIRFGSLIAFFLGALWLGTKAANRAFSLEPTTFIASTAKPDGSFYKAVKYLGGRRSFGTLLVSVFKDYGRRLENLSNIIYIIGILFLMNLLVVPNVPTGSDEPPMAWVMAQFMLPILAIMVAGGVTVQGKERLFIFKKTPSGVARLIKARLVQSWLVVVPIAGAVTVITGSLGQQIASVFLLVNTTFSMLFLGATATFVLGLFLLNPAFSPKSVKLWLNVMIVEFVTIGLFAVALLSVTSVRVSMGPVEGMLYVQLLQTILSWLVGTLFLHFGKRKLNRME